MSLRVHEWCQVITVITPDNERLNESFSTEDTCSKTSTRPAIGGAVTVFNSSNEHALNLGEAM